MVDVVLLKLFDLFLGGQVDKARKSQKINPQEIEGPARDKGPAPRGIAKSKLIPWKRDRCCLEQLGVTSDM